MLTSSIRKQSRLGLQLSALYSFDPSGVRESKEVRALDEAVAFVVICLYGVPVV
jgi:hypothetical protein